MIPGKSIFKKIFLILIAALILGAVIFLLQIKRKSINIMPGNSSQTMQEENSAQPKTASKFFISAWIPYWAKTAGAESLGGNLDIFSELHPFAFGVDADGNLTDVLKIKENPWPSLIEQAKAKKINIVPTILWGDASAMHRIFSNPVLEQKHIEAISNMLTQNNFSGVDIDYEGKDIADKDNFSKFISDLSTKIHPEGKTLNCTLEARTQDSPPTGFSGTHAMSWANDFSVLGKNCDTVTIMAYDQALQIHRAKSFDESESAPSAPNAANDWVDSNVQYALKYIPANKLILGVPTYGWEFSYAKTDSGYHYDLIKSISYPDAMQEAKNAGVTAQRNVQGELYFNHEVSGQNHIVTFEDAESVKEKIIIAKKYDLAGVSIFKIDGLSDPNLFSTLKGEVE